jgi:phosphatidylserine decarboxylase
LPHDDGAWRDRGAELGRFNMGSTVILLLPPAGGLWSEALRSGQTLKMGNAIGHRSP